MMSAFVFFALGALWGVAVAGLLWQKFGKGGVQ